MSHALPLSRLSLLALSTAAALMSGSPAWAQDAPVSKKAAAKKAAALPDLSPEQLANAERVLTGATPCEFNQSVTVSANADKAGYFKINFKGKNYVMAPEPTTTGAVRLEDKKNGVVWLQIANKSMLMNAKIGQRMVDNCVHPSQKI
ncbi:putative signal peptide protein [Leptothrix cholodnii SP-6]|uniref:Putative signal peptide protein n=1 Tax=Leptothrix cholodnii (strain ATCC 51168 / LMG 8142 / SP-6) TaxID=395495 RepID=B1Y8A5_LEPCP|nr:hypothetical protein [Leptothrix cholodnii]ACB34975.1 putative signal peptide protein [Leptothrix cholodnii SP-6]